MTTTVRADVLRFIDRYPAVHAREVERQLGLSSRLASYHLDALERDGLVRRIDAAGYVRFVSARTGAHIRADDLRLLCLLRRAPAFRIVAELVGHPELPQHRLAEALGLAKASVSYHLKMLVGADVLAARDEGRERHYRLVDVAQARRVLQQFAPVPGELDAFSRALLDLLGGERHA